ncbi:MAG: hypothetical protein WCK71_02940 [bacterium]
MIRIVQIRYNPNSPVVRERTIWQGESIDEVFGRIDSAKTDTLAAMTIASGIRYEYRFEKALNNDEDEWVTIEDPRKNNFTLHPYRWFADGRE